MVDGQELGAFSNINLQSARIAEFRDDTDVDELCPSLLPIGNSYNYCQWILGENNPSFPAKVTDEACACSLWNSKLGIGSFEILNCVHLIT